MYGVVASTGIIAGQIHGSNTSSKGAGSATRSYRFDYVSAVRAERRQKMRPRPSMGRSLPLRGNAQGRQLDDNFALAYRLMSSPPGSRGVCPGEGARAARERYGRTRFGQSCLLARRLIERGVRFVTVNMFETVFDEITWDIHGSRPFTDITEWPDWCSQLRSGLQHPDRGPEGTRPAGQHHRHRNGRIWPTPKINPAADEIIILACGRSRWAVADQGRSVVGESDDWALLTGRGRSLPARWRRHCSRGWASIPPRVARTAESAASDGGLRRSADEGTVLTPLGSPANGRIRRASRPTRTTTLPETSHGSPRQGRPRLRKPEGPQGSPRRGGG